MPEPHCNQESDGAAGEVPPSSALKKGASLGLQLSTTEDDPDLRFVELVRQTILQSIDNSQQPLIDQPAIFVRAERPREEAPAFAAQGIRDLESGEANRWLGKLVIAAAHGRSGYAAPLPATLDEALAAIAASRLASAPLILYNPKDRVMACYCGGADDPAPLRFELPPAGTALTLKALLAAMDDYHEESLLSPGVCPLWTNAEEYRPRDNVEKELQWGLVIQLRSTFRPIKVEPEQNSPAGRVDVLFTDPRIDRPGALHPATIEVKALRSRRPNGTSIGPSEAVTNVEEAHSQAAGYRARYRAPLGLLACFDMRQKKSDILKNAKVVKARKTYFTARMCARIYPMFGSAGEAQKYLALKAMAAQGNHASSASEPV